MNEGHSIREERRERIDRLGKFLAAIGGLYTINLSDLLMCDDIALKILASISLIEATRMRCVCRTLHDSVRLWARMMLGQNPHLTPTLRPGIPQDLMERLQSLQIDRRHRVLFSAQQQAIRDAMTFFANPY